MSVGRIADLIISESSGRNDSAAGSDRASQDDVKRMEFDCIGVLEDEGLE